MAEAQATPESRPSAEEVQAPWGVALALAAVLVAVAVDVIGTIVGSSMVYLAGGNTRTLTSLPFEILFYQFLVVGVVIAALLVIWRSGLGTTALGFRFPGWSLLLGSVAAALVTIFLGESLMFLVFKTLLPGFHLGGNAQQIFATAPRHMAIGLKITVFVWAAVEAPLAEETLFRGLMFQGLRNTFNRWLPYRWAVLGGALISGALFGLAHLAGGELHTLPILIFLGIVLAYVFQVTRSIYGSVLVHGLVNGISVIVFLAGR